jgi:cytochrome c-type biogenesis protein CcsB
MTTAIRISNGAFLVALFAYFVAMTSTFAFVAWRSKWLRPLTFAAFAVGLSAHAVSLGAIVIELHRAPWGSMYEFASSGGLVVVIAAVILTARRPQFSAVAGCITGFAVLFMGAGWVWYAPPAELQPALRSNWLTFHVALASIGSSLLLAAAVTSALYLLRQRWEDRNPGWDLITTRPEPLPIPAKTVDPAALATGADAPSDVTPVPVGVPPAGPGAAAIRPPAPAGFVARLPTAQRLDDLSRKLVVVAFPIWTLAIIAGAIWGEQAWGRYWGWDPKETTSFIAWVVFAAYLHARATAGWRGRKAAVIATVGGAVLLFNFFVVNLVISGLHSYAGV